MRQPLVEDAQVPHRGNQLALEAVGLVECGIDRHARLFAHAAIKRAVVGDLQLGELRADVSSELAVSATACVTGDVIAPTPGAAVRQCGHR